MPHDSEPKPAIPRRTIVHAVSGLTLVTILGSVFLMVLGQQTPETLINIAASGLGILGGMAIPQGD